MGIGSNRDWKHSEVEELANIYDPHIKKSNIYKGITILLKDNLDGIQTYKYFILRVTSLRGPQKPLLFAVKRTTVVV